MSRVVWVVMAAWATACSDPTAVCSGTAPVHLLHGEGRYPEHFAAYRSGGFTFLRGVGDGGLTEILAGPACGVEPVPLVAGIPLYPLRLHADPDADDPTLGCDTNSGALFRIDPHGEAAPTLLLPELRCTSARLTDRGVLFSETIASVLRLYPDFPDDTTARRLTSTLDSLASTWPLPILGDELAYVDRDGALRLHDLATGAERRVLERVAAFDITATHILWRERVDALVAPMHLHDRATGEDIYLGLYHFDEDDGVPGGRRLALRDAWSIDPTGKFVLHIPAALEVPMVAFDLTGEPVAFPADGSPKYLFADGTLLLERDSELFVARPAGDSFVIDLPDAALGAIQVTPDTLELSAHNDLYRVSLADGEPRLLARDVGPKWTWLDDERLLTARNRTLTTIDLDGARSVHAEYVVSFTVVADDGAYFTVEAAPGDDRNGLWYLPAAALRPSTDPG